MKYFICVLDSISFKSLCYKSLCYLGIPADHIERIIPADRALGAVHETEGEEAIVSIPALLKLKEQTAPNGLILKTPGPVKNMLLSPKIDVELEIPEDDIYSLPEALAEGLRFLRGAFFTEQKLILILDPQKLIESVAQGECLSHGENND